MNPTEPELIYENADLVVVSKPAGMPVHEAKHSTDYSLCDWLLEKFPEIASVGDVSPRGELAEPYRPGIVHRLDKRTSGVMVVARTQDAFENLKRLFKERAIEKTYLALIVGVPKKKSGVIDAPIGRLRANPTKRGILRQAQDKSALRGSRQATTEYRRLERLGEFSLLAVKPRTGRMHQIRVHLASIGTPVAGDKVYGGGRTKPHGLPRQFLHAWKLAFSYPVGRRWQFEASLPPDLKEVLAGLRRLRKAG